MTNVRFDSRIKLKATRLRQAGKSYSEIALSVGVSRSTLCSWLKKVPVSKKQERFRSERTKILQDRGRLKTAELLHRESVTQQEKEAVMARADYRRFREDPFFTAGLALYWGDGAQSSNYVSYQTQDFSKMQCMMRWCEEYLTVDPISFSYRLFARRGSSTEKYIRAWSRACAIPRSQITGVDLLGKKTRQTTQKMNLPEGYHGSLRLNIFDAQKFRSIQTWQKCLYEEHLSE